MKNITIIVLTISLFASCKKKTVPEQNSLFGADYYPVTKGKYVIYDVDSVIYTQTPLIDTVNYRYRIKEKIADDFVDNQGQKAIRLERYIKKYNPLKPYDSIPWGVKEVWMLNATNKSIQLAEGNIRYTKIIFPIKENASWNGNANNNFGELMYTIEYFDRPETINNIKLDNVMLVRQKDSKTLISYERQAEKFAKGIGLVYKEYTQLFSNKIVANVPVEGRIETGFTYKLSYVTFGYE